MPSIATMLTVLRTVGRRDPAVEHEILLSLARYDWWRPYGEQPPNPIPASFEAVSEHIGPMPLAPPLYYVLASRYLRLLRLTELQDQYFALRWLSVVLALPTLWCAWGGARLLLGGHRAVVSTALLALHPQFVLMSIAASPDVVVNFCGAFVWWQAARLLLGHQPAVSAVTMTVAAVSAMYTKRIGAPLILMATYIWLLAIVRLALVSRKRAGLLLAMLAVLGGSVAYVAQQEVIPHPTLTHWWGWGFFVGWADRPTPPDAHFFVRFVTGLFQSGWLYAGWLRFPAPSAWYLLALGMTVIGVGGFVRLLWTRQKTAILGVVTAGALASIQLALVLFFFLYRYGIEGRYLFPVAAPLAALAVTGWRGWADVVKWPWVLTVLLAGSLFLDVTGWTTVIIPAYVR